MDMLVKMEMCKVFTVHMVHIYQGRESLCCTYAIKC